MVDLERLRPLLLARPPLPERSRTEVLAVVRAVRDKKSAIIHLDHEPSARLGSVASEGELDRGAHASAAPSGSNVTCSGE